MNANRAFSLLLWLGLGGLILLVAAAMRLALGVWPDQSLHDGIDGICIIAPVHSDFVSHTLSYGVAVLLLGVFGLGLRYLGRQVAALRTMREDIAGAIPGENQRVDRVVAKAGIDARVRLLISPRRAAFTAGLWRPSVFLTTGLVEGLTDPQLEAVLLHEQCHAGRRDPLRAAVAHALGAMLFFLPVLRELAAYLHIRKEVEADAATVRQQGTPVHLASALYKLGDPTSGTASVAAVGFTEVASVQARIEALSTGSWRGTPLAPSAVRWSVAGALLLLALVAHPLTSVYSWWTVALSLAACPAWILVFWVTRSRTA